MQSYNWNDLKFLLAVSRTGNLSEAGRRLGVSDTTVARRLQHLEQAIGTSLVLRTGVGTYSLTDAGQLIIEQAEAIERQALDLGERLGQLSDSLSGVVRISSVPAIIDRILVPGIVDLRRQHPELTVELIPEARNVDLTKREADLAVRFSRPAEGGLAVKSIKLGELGFGIFCAVNTPSNSEDGLDWIEYDDASTSLPQAQWTQTQRKRSNGRASPLRVADITSALEAAAAGLGKAILPNMVATADNRLRVAEQGTSLFKMTRDVWLLSHADQDRRLSIAAAKTWLKSLSWQ